MGSKGPSGNTTTTVQQQNPAQQAQLPQLQDLWNYAGGLWQQPSSNIAGMQGYAQDQAQAAAPYSSQVMPAATGQYLNQIRAGLPAAGQAGQLTANAGQAVDQGLNYANALSGAANTALNQVPNWQNWFLSSGNNALNSLAGIGTNATSALSGVGQQALNTLPGMGQAATSALTGLAPGALGGLSSLSGQAATAGNPAEMGLNATAGMALGNPALSSGLRGLASGAYINPSTNPAYAGMLQAATQPLVNQYETATGPQVASQFEGAGRYGSGAQTNAQGQAQYGLGQALSNAVSGITNNAYNTGLNATLGAGQALGGIYNQGISNMTGALGTSGQLAQAGAVNAGNLLNQGYGTAGNLLNQGYGTGANIINQGLTSGTNALSNAYNIGGNLTGQGYNTLNAMMGNAANTGLGYLNAGLSGLGAGANAAQAGYGTANTALTGGGNLLNQSNYGLTNALSQAGNFAGYPTSQFTAAYSAPWLPLNNAAGIFGGALGGTGTSTQAVPYYSNTGANILSGLGGAANIANTLGGAQGVFPGALQAAGSALLGLFGSDRRLRRDIRRIGALRNGLPIYSFRYVGSTRMQVGLMADEVEQVHPEAVVAVGPYRVKMVDYAKAVQ